MNAARRYGFVDVVVEPLVVVVVVDEDDAPAPLS